MPPVGIFYTLVEDARRAWPIVRRSVREGIGADRTFQALRDQGFTVTRQVIRDLARAERAMQARVADLRFLNRDARPDITRLPIALTTQLRQFRFVVEIRGRDKDTGELVKRTVSVSIDNLATRAEIEDIALSFVRESPLEIISTVVLEGQIAGPAGTLL